MLEQVRSQVSYLYITPQLGVGIGNSVVEVRAIDTDSDESDIIYYPSLDTLSRVLGNGFLKVLGDDEEVVALTKSDLTVDENGISYGEEHLVLTNKRILVIKDKNIVKEFKLKDVSSASLRDYLSTIILTLDIRGSAISVITLSRARKKQFEKIITLINDITFHKIPYNMLKKHLSNRVNSESEKAKSSKGILIKLFGFVKPLWYMLLITSMLSIATTTMNLLPPYLMKILIDEVLIPRSNLDKLLMIILGLLGVNLSLTILGVLRSYALLKLNQKLAFRLRARIYEHIQFLSLNFYDKFSRGAIISRIVDDVNRVLYFLTQGFSTMILDLAMIVFVGLIMFSMSPWLSYIALLPVPVSILGTAIYRKVMPKYYHRLWRKWSRVISTLSESLSAIILVKTLGKESNVIKRFKDNLNEFIDSNIEVFKNEQKFWPFIGLSFTFSNLIVWWLGGLQVLNGALTLGSLTAFVSYMWSFYRPINDLANHLRLVQQVIVAGERIFEVLSTKPESADKPGARDLTIVGGVELKNVWFTYDGIHYALKDVSFRIEPGEHVGIVGPSGSGKTTLTKLLLRLYEPQRGSVLIDGVDVRDIKSTSLKKQIAIVMQNPILFNTSIAENIAIGKEDASLEEIIAAAKAARAHDFIMKLPEAYDTEVGVYGGRLSGGERQRIAIAAALLKDPKVLILDEPTSSLDALTERDVTEAIGNLTKNRTTIIIAHRLSTLRNVDKIIVLDKGTVIEQGSHEQLIRTDGLYKRLFEAQFADFLDNRRRRVLLRG